MAEILISLTIIGIIAAITLPSLRANINEKTWATQRKALYSRMSQAISMMPSLNGYGEYAGSWSANSVNVTADTAAQAFVTDGLAKVLKINNICSISANTSAENTRKELKKCGIPEKFTNIANSKLDFPTKLSEFNPLFTSAANVSDGSGGYVTIYNPQRKIDTAVAAFETKNNESVAVFYNPYCISSDWSGNYYATQPYMCANFVYDLNGTKGPNAIGKDMGVITVLYPTDPVVVAPIPLKTNFNPGGGAFSVNFNNALKACTKQASNARLPNRDELLSIFYNQVLFGGFTANDDIHWSRTVASATRTWAVNLKTGVASMAGQSTVYLVRCIEK